jgi:hypothetical protein
VLKSFNSVSDSSLEAFVGIGNKWSTSLVKFDHQIGRVADRRARSRVWAKASLAHPAALLEA